jgi:hypothetical protein
MLLLKAFGMDLDGVGWRAIVLKLLRAVMQVPLAAGNLIVRKTHVIRSHYGSV